MGHADENLSIRLDRIGGTVSEIYQPVVEHLQQVRVLARSFETGIQSLKSNDHAPQDAQDTDLNDSVDTAAVALRDAITQAHEVVVDPQLQDLLVGMHSDCAQLIRFSRELNSLSFLMLVTTANGLSHGFSVEHLVKELRDMAVSLRGASEKISATLTRISGTRKEAGDALRSAAELIEKSIGSLSCGTLNDLNRGEAARGFDAVQQMSDALSQEVARLMPGIVACMQHPDAFAQRCDHMARAAELLHDAGEDSATGTALAQVIAAQTGDMRHELEAVQGDALTALDQIIEKGGRTLDGFERWLAEDERLKRVSDRQVAVGESAAALKHISEVAKDALHDLLVCMKMFDEIKETFGALNQMRAAVRMSSMNADLSERRSKVNMPELRSVTKAVGDCANSCGTIMADLDKGYHQVSALFSGVRQDAIDSAIASVGKRLEVSKRDLSSLSDQIATLRSLTSDCAKTLGDLTRNGRAARDRIDANRMALKQLAAIQADLSTAEHHVDATEGILDAETLGRVFESYSIEREREVHRAVFPENCPSQPDMPEDAIDGDDDPLAEFLF